jgi:hypothetical protein
VCVFGGGMLLSYCRIRTHKIEKKNPNPFQVFFPTPKKNSSSLQKMNTLFAGIFLIDLFQRFGQ